jgi:hypothetical protein
MAIVIGGRVKTTGAATVRSGAGSGYAVVGAQMAGALGTAKAFDVSWNSGDWWQVDFDSGVDGWVNAAQLAEDVVVPPTPIPPTPTPIPPGNIVLLGSATANRQFREGPADRINASVVTTALAAQKPWTFFATPDEKFAVSRNGQPGSNWARLPVWGNFGGLYKGLPRIRSNGQQSNLTSKAPGDDVALNITPYVNTYEVKAGARGNGVTTPYTAWRSHTRRLADGTLSMDPNVPYIVGLDVLGNVTYRMRSGEIRIVHRVAGVLDMHDWTPRPASRKFFASTDTGHGRVMETFRNLATFTDTQLFQIPRPTSVRYLPDDTLAIVSGNLNNPTLNSVWMWRAGRLSKLCDLPYAFYLDYDEFNRFVCLTLDLGVFLIDPNNPTPVQIRARAEMETWATISVDRNGTCGEKGNMLIAGTHIQNNASAYMRRAGVWIDALDHFGRSSGQATVGASILQVDILGHYGWSLVYGEDDASIYSEGASDLQGSVLCPRGPHFAAEDNYDHNSFVSGRKVIEMGCGPGTPYGTVPSFTCQMSDQGWSAMGITADYVADMPFPQQAAFIQAGMLGSFPRPYIKGRDLYRTLYLLNRSSQRFLREGVTLMQGLLSYCAPMFGQELPAVSQPNIDATDTNYFVDVNLSAGVLSLKFRDQWGGNKAGYEPGATFRIYVDEGFTSQIDAGTVSGTSTVPLPPLASGQHSVRAVYVSGSTNPFIYRTRASVVVMP